MTELRNAFLILGVKPSTFGQSTDRHVHSENESQHKLKVHMYIYMYIRNVIVCVPCTNWEVWLDPRNSFQKHGHSCLRPDSIDPTHKGCGQLQLINGHDVCGVEKPEDTGELVTEVKGQPYT